MATVTGDIAYDFSGLPNANPWVNADFTDIQNSFIVSSGSLKAGAVAACYTLYTATLPTNDKIRAKIELSNDSSVWFDSLYAIISDASGNGYRVQSNGNQITLSRLDAFSATELVQATGQSYSANSELEVELDVSTGDLEVFLNSTSIITSNDTAHSSGLLSGFGVTWDNSNANGIVSFAGDGYAVAPSNSVIPLDETPEDSAQQSFTTTGLTGPITAATLGGVDILSLLSNTDPETATTYTYDISNTEASTGTARIGETSTLSITATGGTATQDVTIQPKTGWSVVELSGSLRKETDSEGRKDLLKAIDDDLGITTAVGDIVYWNASNNASIGPDGTYTSGLTSAGQFTELVVIQGGTATTPATSEGARFYPYGRGGSTPATKFRRFPWQPFNKA